MRYFRPKLEGGMLLNYAPGSLSLASLSPLSQPSFFWNQMIFSDLSHLQPATHMLSTMWSTMCETECLVHQDHGCAHSLGGCVSLGDL